MDRKSIVILAASVALLIGWNWVVPQIFPPVPAPVETNPVPRAAELAQATNAAPRSLAPAQPDRTPPAPAPSVREETLKLETAEAVYTFTSHGGGIKRVELKRYPESVGKDAKGAAARALVTLNEQAPSPVMALRGGAALTGDDVYTLTRISAARVRAEKVLSNGLWLVKEFELAANYVVNTEVRIQNRGAQPVGLPAQAYVIGSATPMTPYDDETLMGVYWYNGAAKSHIDTSWFENKTMGCAASNPRFEYQEGNSNVVWAAVHNQFFTLITLASTNQPAGRIQSVRTALPAPGPEAFARDSRTRPNPHAIETSLVYPAETLAPNQKLERRFMVYAGPKEYKTLSQFPERLDLVMEFDGFFGFFAKILLLSMNGLYKIVPDFKYLSGYATTIVLITVIIKAVFWPLTQASTRSMKRMQELQPQMKALQEKYKDEPSKMNRKLMEFMKENKVSPLGGCWPMLLQIPVFFGFFQMIRSAIELRGAHFLWAADLSQADTVWMIPGLDWPVNPLPLLMGVTMVWQAQMTPPSPGMDPVQQKMMKYMPVMFMVFLYNFSAALTLYWTVQNLLTIAQMKLTKSTPRGPAGAAPAKAPAALIPPKKGR